MNQVEPLRKQTMKTTPPPEVNLSPCPQLSTTTIIFFAVLTSYIVLVLFFTVNHVYLEWDEIMFKVVGRKFVNEPGSELFNEFGFYKAPLFSFLIGIFGAYDFLVVAVAGVSNFLLLSLLLSYALENKKNTSHYWLLGLILFTFSFQIQYYFIVFYAETLSMTFVLCSVLVYVTKKHPALLAAVCFCAFLTKMHFALLFVFYPCCYLFTKTNRRSILPFILASIILLMSHLFIEFAVTDKFAKSFLTQFHKINNTNPWIIENKALSLGFYPLALFDVLGIPNGILFYTGSIFATWKVFQKKSIPEVVKISYLLIFIVILLLTFISTKSDRFIFQIIPLVIVVNIWTLFNFRYLLIQTTNNHAHKILTKTTFSIIALVLVSSTLGMYSLFRYNPLLSRVGYSFSEPRSLGSPIDRFFWRTYSDKTQLVYQYNILYHLKTSARDKAIFTDLWIHYVFANFGHQIIPVKTNEMERPKMNLKIINPDLKRIEPENVPTGSFFLGKHEFKNSTFVGQCGDIKGLIIN